MFRLAILLLCLAIRPVMAAEMFAGPVEAQVISVTDGDTVKVEAFIWPGQSLRIAVRLRGVNAPELKSRCARERADAKAARAALAAKLGGGHVTLTNISGEKYYGRVLADLTGPDGAPVSAWLLAEGLAAPYSGGKRLPAC